MDDRLPYLVLTLVLATFPLAAVGVFSGPQSTSVLQGGDATLYCSKSDFDGLGVIQWSEGTTFANALGVFLDGPENKYSNFAVDTGSTNPVSQLNLVISNVEVSDEGSYTCEITPDSGTAELRVEIQVASVSITVDGASPGTPVIAREGVEMTLVCLATGARPAVSIDWTNDGTLVPGDVEETTVNNDVTDTRSTLQFTPTKEDDGHLLRCQTAGQQVAPAQSEDISLNVQFRPVVMVSYGGGKVTCSAEANPLATSYDIILNGTEVYQTLVNSGQSVDYMPDYCTTISCNATNTLGTGTDALAEQICPGYVDMTTKEATTPTKKPSEKPAPQTGISGGVIAAIIIVCLIIILVAIIATLWCYRNEKFCFGTKESAPIARAV